MENKNRSSKTYILVSVLFLLCAVAGFLTYHNASILIRFKLLANPSVIGEINLADDSSNYSGITDEKTKIKLNCPTETYSTMYDGLGQSSGIMCPAGSVMTGDITGKNAGRYTLRCEALEGYEFESECKVNWQITQGVKNGTITFHKNVEDDDFIVKEYDRTQDKASFVIPNNWTREGYVLAGWAEAKNASVPSYGVSDEFDVNFLMKSNSTVFTDLYAVWVPVNNEYGNVLFLGDSYIHSSDWANKVANTLNLGYSYNTLYKDNASFVNAENNFISLLEDSNKIIGDNNNVKSIIVAAGYNDYMYSYEEIKNSIISFGIYMNEIYPSATLYLSMIGTDFINVDIENTLLTTVEQAYKDAADMLWFAEYIPYTEGMSVSGYLKGFGENDSKYLNSCSPNKVSSSCYYWKEEASGVIGIHPSTTSGNIIAEAISNYLKKA